MADPGNYTNYTVTGNFTNSTANFTNSTVSPTNVSVIEPLYPGPGEAILAAILVLIILFVLLENIFVLVVFCKVPRLRKPGPMYFVVLITVAHLITVPFLLIPSLISIIMGAWKMGDVFCSISAYVANVCYHLTVHTLGLICFERYLRICRPIKHEEIFSEMVTAIVVMGIVFFDCVLVVFPLAGWGEYAYLPLEYQCRMTAIGWQKQVSHLHFTFVMTLVIPLAFSIACWVLILGRIREHRRVGADPGDDRAGSKSKDSYGDRVRRSQDKMKRRILRKRLKIPMSEKEASAKKRAEKERRVKSELSDSSSSEDEESVPVGHRKYVHARNVARKVRYRVYEVAMARTVFWTWIAFFICWFPYFICKYVETYESSPLPQGILLTAVFVTHISYALFPIIYVADNRRLRLGFLQVFGRKKTGSFDVDEDYELEQKKGSAYKPGENKKTTANSSGSISGNESKDDVAQVAMTPIQEMNEE
ncbi:5-hydroxytryptamine receptor 7-like [Ptychodera flava]|uniref:5-hydroxytryptamine receptor 7-like n=1 Tax=Ptychodera flava TaxID=63121 RepID=UPI003969C308